MGIPESRRWVYQRVGGGYTRVWGSSGSHHKTYAWQAGGTHSTGMFSCLTSLVS